VAGEAGVGDGEVGRGSGVAVAGDGLATAALPTGDGLLPTAAALAGDGEPTRLVGLVTPGVLALGAVAEGEAC
jgi:hypothetical protein